MRTRVFPNSRQSYEHQSHQGERLPEQIVPSHANLDESTSILDRINRPGC